MAGEDKDKIQKGKPADAAPEPQSTSVEAMFLDDQENKPLKVALLIAIALHLLLFWWNLWPDFSVAAMAREDRTVILVKRFIPKKPPPQKKEIQKMKKKKVPIPDPTPDEPEPIVEAEPEPEPELDLDADFIIGIPEGPPVPDGPVRAGFGATTPVVIHRVDPVYPELARRAKVQGTVILEAIIRRDGTVGDIKILRSLGKLGCDEAAVTALKKWRFTPGEMNGHPVDVIMTLTIKFVLE